MAQTGGQGGSSVVETAWYWSDLWKDCYEDSTAVVNCVDFGVLWTVKPYIQAVRALLLPGLCLGLAGIVLSFFGMECTWIGGDQSSKYRALVAACVSQLLGAVSGGAGYCLYINKVTSAVLHRKADPSKLSYEIGLPLYLGLVGTLLLSLGCTVHCATAHKVIQPRRPAATFHSSRQNNERKALRGKMRTNSSRISSHKLTSVVIV